MGANRIRVLVVAIWLFACHGALAVPDALFVPRRFAAMSDLSDWAGEAFWGGNTVREYELNGVRVVIVIGYPTSGVSVSVPIAYRVDETGGLFYFKELSPIFGIAEPYQKPASIDLRIRSQSDEVYWVKFVETSDVAQF